MYCLFIFSKYTCNLLKSVKIEGCTYYKIVIFFCFRFFFDLLFLELNVPQKFPSHTTQVFDVELYSDESSCL